MSFLDNITNGISDWWDSDKNDGVGLDITDIIAILGGGAAAAGLFDSDQKQVGYQGKIPDYKAIRRQVPMNFANSREPGEYGQRYFTDTIFADNPNSAPQTIEQANANVALQQERLKQRNANRGEGINDPSFAGGGIVEAMANLRGAGVPKPPNAPPMPQQQGIPQAGQYLRGPTDGMGDKVNINAADGEFVMPADVVSHLGNGNSDAGAKQLEDMMARIRQARTGSTQQGTQINPNNFIPA